MKKLVLLFLATICSFVILAQETNSNFDEELAAKLGADEYGMKTYVFVLLKTGDNPSTDETLRNESFAAHFSNMKDMAEQGKLVVAGPMFKNDKNIRGIFIFNVASIEEAHQCVENDLAIKNGFLKPEFFLWYGSAALPEYLPFEEKIWKKKP